MYRYIIYDGSFSKITESSQVIYLQQKWVIRKLHFQNKSSIRHDHSVWDFGYCKGFTRVFYQRPFLSKISFFKEIYLLRIIMSWFLASVTQWTLQSEKVLISKYLTLDLNHIDGWQPSIWVWLEYWRSVRAKITFAMNMINIHVAL